MSGTGGAGSDVLVGGGEHDVFRYLAVSDSGGTARDRITDLAAISAGGADRDRIDLSAIDAVPGGANDAFAFIGAGAFTAVGQVRARIVGETTFITANTDGVLTTAEMTIAVAGAVTFAAGDFIL